MEILTNQVMNKRNEGVFDEFYLDYLDKLEKYLEEILDEKYNFEFEKNEVIGEAIYSLKNVLINIGAKTLLGELKKFKKENKTDCTYEDYISFISDSQFNIYFNEKYIVLAELLEQKVNSFVELFKECFTRLSADKESIEESFGIKLKNIINVSFSEDGDTHNGGKSVIRLDINDGKSLFYKPHNLSMDVIFKEIIEVVEKRLNGFEYNHVNTIDKKEYGWQEAVTYREAYTPDDIKNYYYSVGVTMAIFHLLGTEDIHSGNLISRGDTPAYIDLEVLLANKNLSYFSPERNKCVELNKLLNNSVLGVYLLPNNLPEKLIDIDISALTSGQNIGTLSEKLSYLGLADKGTIDIHYEKMLSKNYETLSIEKYKGKVVEADGYIDYIADGFTDAYKAIMADSQKIEAILEKHQEDKIRQVMRATYVYGKFLDAAYHPNYLQSASERRRLFGLIDGEKKAGSIRTQIADKEVRMLYKDDIPYFYTKFDSCDLYCICDGKETVVEKVYTNSLKDSLKKKLDAMSKEDMNIQLDLIYLSFANFGKYRINSLERQDKRLYKSLARNSKLPISDRYLKSIYESILDRCIKLDDIRAVVGLEPDITGDYRISYMAGNLYNGLGIAYFMALADKRFGNKDSNKVLELIRGMEQISPYKFVPNNIGSAYAGLVGRVYVYNQLYKQTGIEEYADYYNEILDYLVETALQETDVLDYVTGIAGGIVALINLYKDNSDQRIKKIIDKYIIFMKQKIEVLDYGKTLNGMAHGLSGLIIALFSIYEYTADEYFYHKAVELVKQEDGAYSESMGNWKDMRDGKYDMAFWCHGAAGIGLTRAATLKYVNHDVALRKIWFRDIENAVAIIKKRGLNFELKHGICHGVMGNLVILDYISEIMSDDDLHRFTRRQLDKLLIELEFKPIQNENNLNTQDIGFMLGLSGIGYSIMRLTDRAIPNVLLLEV